MIINLISEITFFLTTINRGYHQKGRDHLKIALLISLFTLHFISLPKYKQYQPRYLNSCIQFIIVYSIISHHRSNLSVGGVFREITPDKANALCCRNSGRFLPRIAAPDNASTYDISSVFTSSFHYRNIFQWTCEYVRLPMTLNLFKSLFKLDEAKNKLFIHFYQPDVGSLPRSQ